MPLPKPPNPSCTKNPYLALPASPFLHERRMSAATKNPFTWVEVYVSDMDRARRFYEHVFAIEMIPMQAPGDFGDLEMLSFPWAEGEMNISGALCKTKEFQPGPGGTIVYFACDDCALEASRVEAAGGLVLQPKFSISEHGFVALVQDSEGNTIGLHSTR